MIVATRRPILAMSTRETTVAGSSHSRRRATRGGMCLQIVVVFKTQKLSVQLTRGDRINSGHHGGENRIGIFIETGQEISDQFIIAQRCARRRKFISKVAHLGVVIRDCELVLLGGGEGDTRVDDTCSSLRGVEVGQHTPLVCHSRTPRHMHQGLPGE
jgi:hypothetical protein